MIRVTLKYSIIFALSFLIVFLYMPEKLYSGTNSAIRAYAPKTSGYAPSIFVKTQKNVALGWFHTVFVKSDGTVLSWGYNKYGQLGNGKKGTGTNINVPAYVLSQTGTDQLDNIVTVAAGSNHSVAVNNAGNVFCWGDNSAGQLGNGSFISSAVPVPITNSDLSIIAAEAGEKHTLALSSDGTVWAWGYNQYGQIGDGTYGITSYKTMPVRVKAPDSNGFLNRIVSIKAGLYFSMALKDDGTVWSWGQNTRGQLGNGENGSGKFSILPTQVKGPDNDLLTHVIAIAAGDDHALALRDDGTVWAWGKNSNGQLGNGNTTDTNLPTIVFENLDNIKSISAGRDHSVALKDDGTLWAWGYNSYGQLGNQSVVILSSKPVIVQSKDITGITSNITEISCGGDHSMALANDGTLLGWGYDTYGQLGIAGTTSTVYFPTPVRKPDNTAILNTGYPKAFNSAKIYFSITDIDTPISEIAVSAEASNTKVVQDITINHQSSLHFIEILFNPYMTGKSNIRLTANDSNNVSTCQFEFNIPTVAYPIGDINHTGTLDLKDLLIILSALANQPSSDQIFVESAIAPGKIKMSDAIFIFRQISL